MAQIRNLQAICVALAALAVLVSAERSFIVSGNSFVKDGQPIQLISGSMHYFRSFPDQWEDRLLKMKAAGLNTVQTYVPWNLHQPEKNGDVLWTGLLDLPRFLDTAHKVGLLVVLRPPPYICAEWEFGGLPSWLLSNPDVVLRSSEVNFLAAVEQFMTALLKKVHSYQYHLGGPIIIMQIENEYGSYGSDHEYLRRLRNMFLANDIKTILNTCNGDWDQAMLSGNIPDLFSPTYLRTVNFGNDPQQGYKVLKRYQPTGPFFVTEYWPGWFDLWGIPHQTRNPDIDASVVDQVLALNGSINMYMFHGGTNFGFANGAESNPYSMITTSYDYDAPLSEAGDPTEKYHKIRDVIKKYVNVPAVVPPASKKMAYGAVQLTRLGSLFDQEIFDRLAKKPVTHVYPMTFEKLNQNFGFVLYQTTVTEAAGTYILQVPGLHGRGLVYAEGYYQGTITREVEQNSLPVNIYGSTRPIKLNVFVENTGRVNYGNTLGTEYAGMREVIFGNFLSHWTMHSIPMSDDDIRRLPPKATPNSVFFGDTPTFYKGNFTVQQACDTFLELPGWKKGQVWINNFNIGRFWHVGPQQTLYVPAPLLHVGENSIVVLEIHGSSDVATATVQFRDTPVLDRLDQ